MDTKLSFSSIAYSVQDVSSCPVISSSHDEVVIVQGTTFTLGKTLGRGGQGVVRLGTRPDGNKCALKFIDKENLSSRDLNLLRREVTAQRAVGEKSEHVSTLFACDDNVLVYPQEANPQKNKHRLPPRTFVVLVLELSSGGELLDQLMYGAGAFNETLARTYFVQLCDALGTCHKLGFAHRDVKLENIVLDGGSFALRLCDFGFCSEQQQQASDNDDDDDDDGEVDQNPRQNLCATECGTSTYQSPEVLRNSTRGSIPYDGVKADLWSVGVVLFVMVMGYPPLERANTADWYFAALSKGRTDRFWQAHNRTLPAHGDYPSHSFMDLVSRLLCVDPNRRVTLEEVLRHPWTLGKPLGKEEVEHGEGGTSDDSSSGPCGQNIDGPSPEFDSYSNGPLLSPAQLAQTMAARARLVAIDIAAKEQQPLVDQTKEVVTAEGAKALGLVLANDGRDSDR
eukprot:CAMPEP_0171611150 /NCGR_PEP_ID=MMETSP0990-20121206/10459_1 /TAXON_ID=483369 /ORGANISM="non described non described, Strain CCMP2098" /LENGTH=452 /DNA_ID=CAMNT_0012174667 /DNA_START=31 /DNA_END=1389 /DNA_ORIENTATION=-